MSKGQSFPWEAAMRFGLGRLRLSPHEFWRMTPRELGAAMSGLEGLIASGRPPTRTDLDRLMQTYPDNGGGNARKCLWR